MRDTSGEVDMSEAEAAFARDIAKRLKRTRGDGRLPEHEPQREAERLQTPAQPARPAPPPMPNADVVALVRRVAAGGKFVHVEKLIGELTK